MMDWIIAFDVSSNKRRRKLTDILIKVGYRIQHSVFEARLKSSELKDTLQKIEDVISAEEDKVYLWPMEKDSQKKAHFIGLDSRHKYENFEIIS
jgi:CRISPR-associated protein Cas2